MSFTTEQRDALAGPLGRMHIKKRQQAGRTFDYIEGWFAISEANRIFGFDAWNRETVELRLLGEPRKVDDKMRVGYMARVRITVFAGDRIVIREGCGFGSGIDRDVDQAHESAIKEAETDAMKRALVTFGNPFGLTLYDKAQASVVSYDPAAEQAADSAKRQVGVRANGKPTASAAKPKWQAFLDKLHSFTDPEVCAAWFESDGVQNAINEWPKGDAGDWAELAADEYDAHVRKLWNANKEGAAA